MENERNKSVESLTIKYVDEMIKYVDDMFPHWKDQDMPQTYVTPPIFTYENKHIPSEGASNNYPGPITTKHKSQSLEEYVMNIFIRFGDYSTQPMFVFPNFEFHKLATWINKQKIVEYKLNLEKQKEQKETDIIIVHRKYGIIIVEVKSSKNKYKDAKDQLDKAEKWLYDNILLSKYFQLDNSLKDYVVRKVFACPCQDESETKNDGYINLHKNHIDTYENFSRWWHSNIVEWQKCCSMHGMQINKYCESVYCDLVPKFLCNPKIPGVTVNRNSMHSNVSMKEIQNDLEKQKSLQEQVISQIKSAELNIKKAESEKQKAESEIKDMESKLSISTLQIEKAEKHIKEAKALIDNVESQIQKLKGNSAITQRIIPTHTITETTSVLQKIWKFVTQEQSEVWRKKQQKIYGPYGSGKTVLIQCKAADLACDGEKVFILLPTDHLIIKYKTFFESLKHMHPKINKVSIIIIEEDKKHDVYSSTHTTAIKQAKEHWNSNGGKIMLVPLMTFLQKNRLYKELAELSHIFADELLWLPIVPYKITSFTTTSFLYDQMRERRYYAWIAPHLYVILTYLFVKKKTNLNDDGLGYFGDLYNPKILTTTLHTTKQIHDFIIQKEWQDFFKYKDKRLEYALDMLFEVYSKIFNSVLCSSHGHHITGPPVRIFNDITNQYQYPSENHFQRFIKYSAQVIRSEIDRSYGVQKIKPKDMAVIVDTCAKEHIRIKHMLINELKETAHYKFSSIKDPDYMLMYTDPNNRRIKPIVTICNSDDIASFEWQLVIHVKYIYHCNYRFDYTSEELTYYDSYHNMIASRCTMQYIIICCKDAEDAWPHNKSFQDFKLQCEKTNKFEKSQIYAYLRE